jgi:hypothetical protein
LILEAIGLVGITAVIMYLFAETQKPIAGIFASILLMILSFWILTSGVQIQTGETHFDTNVGLELGTANGTDNGSTTASGSTSTFNQGMRTNITTATSGTTNSTVNNQYGDIPSTPIAPVPQTLGMVLLLFSLYTFFYYLFATINSWR